MGGYTGQKRRDYDNAWRQANLDHARLKDKARYRGKRKAQVILRAKKYSLKVNYGLTLEDVEAMLLEQNFKCVICDCDLLTARMHIDHNHKTGRVRGLLCHHCNTALGNLRDDITIVRKALDYLEKDLAFLSP